MAKSMYFPLNAFQNVQISLSRPVRQKCLILPQKKPEEILNKLDITLLDYTVVDGNPTLLEQLLLVTLVKQAKPKRVFEFGTFDGKTSGNLALNLPKSSEILTIDLPKEQLSEAKMGVSMADKRLIMKESIGGKIQQKFENITQVYGDTAQFDFSPYHNTCDVVFIDACHTYDYVRNDSEQAMKLLKKGGLVIWHDYGTWPGVTQALNELHQTQGDYQELYNIADTSLAVLQR